MTKTILISHFYNYERLLKIRKTVNAFIFLNIKINLDNHFVFMLI